MSSAAAILIVVFSALIAAFSQLLLKKSAGKKHDNLFREYLNARVIISYAITGLTTLITMYSMLWIPYKTVSVMASFSYIFVVILSKIFLKERIRLGKWVGIILIFMGIVIFNL